MEWLEEKIIVLLDLCGYSLTYVYHSSDFLMVLDANTGCTLFMVHGNDKMAYVRLYQMVNTFWGKHVQL